MGEGIVMTIVSIMGSCYCSLSVVSVVSVVSTSGVDDACSGG